MGNIIVKNAVKREKGYMYYIDGEGNLCKAKLARRKPKELTSSKDEEEE